MQNSEATVKKKKEMDGGLDFSCEVYFATRTQDRDFPLREDRKVLSSVVPCPTTKMEGKEGGVASPLVCTQLSDLTDEQEVTSVDFDLASYVPGGLFKATTEKWDRCEVGTLCVGDKAPDALVHKLLSVGGGEQLATPEESVSLLRTFLHPLRTVDNENQGEGERRFLVLNFGSYRLVFFSGCVLFLLRI